MSIYTLIIVVLVPTLVTLILNLCMFKYARSSSRRIRIQNPRNRVNVIVNQQPAKISRRDIFLLRHAIFMFAMFILGWTPIFSLVAIDYHGTVTPLVYTILEILAAISSLCCMLDLFLYNHELRLYIKNKLVPCF